jgi:HEAT repeat protein
VARAGAVIAAVRLRRHAADPIEQLRAVYQLANEPASCAALLEAARSPSNEVARVALRRLRALGGQHEAAILRERLFDVDLGLVGAYAETLQALGDEEAAGIARGVLKDASSTKRLAAAIALRELKDERSRAALLTALADPIAGVRHEAAEALGRLAPDPKSEEQVAELLDDRDAEVRAAVVRTLVRTASDLEDRLRPTVFDPEPRVRRELARASARLREQTVRMLVGDASADVRADVMWALVERPRPELVAVEIGALSDPAWPVRRAAARALGVVGAAVACDPLLQTILDPHPTVRAAGLRALREILGDRLVDRLGGELDRSEAPLRRALVYALAETRDARAARWIAPLDRDPDPFVRVAVVHALKTLRAGDWRRIVARLADDVEPHVHHAAETALGELDR